MPPPPLTDTATVTACMVETLDGVGVTVTTGAMMARETVTPMGTLLVKEPEVPVTVAELVPGVATEDAVRVRVETAVPLAAGVNEAGEKVAVTPLGRPAMLSATGEMKPLELATVMVLVAAVPWLRASVDTCPETENAPLGKPVE